MNLSTIRAKSSRIPTADGWRKEMKSLATLVNEDGAQRLMKSFASLTNEAKPPSFLPFSHFHFFISEASSFLR